jgi:hypothetical protein
MMGRMVVVVLFVLPVIAIFATDMLLDVMKQLAQLNAEDAQVVTQIVYELRSIGFLFLSVIIMLCMLSFYFVFFLAVRVYGPQIALIRFIDQLKSGNYERFRNLRRDDQLKETWQALQELADSLREKHGPKSKG